MSIQPEPESPTATFLGAPGAVVRLLKVMVLQFDGEAPHRPVELVELPIKFLSIIAYGERPEH